MTPARLTRSEARQLLRKVVNYPIFVPELGGHVTRLLVDGNIPLLVQELQRLSSLGSKPASVLLGYLCLRGVFGATDPQRAEKLCIQAAKDGDPYAQYVVGWVCRVRRNDVQAVSWLVKASKGLFLPAMVDLARFMAGGVGVESADMKAALSVLWDAHKLGHRMALMYIAEICKRSGTGFFRLAGWCLYPVAAFRAAWFVNRYPVSDQSFVTSLVSTRPLFKATGPGG